MEKSNVFKYVFFIILMLHGLIHLMGFAKSFYFTEVDKQVLGIPKPIGALWLITFILFVVSTSLFLRNKKWFYLTLIGVFVSQILIIIFWKDAKFGTIVNVLILLVSISALGNHRFKKMVQKESTEILSNITNISTVISEKDLNHLPEITRKWIQNSGVIGKEKIASARLKQIGNMRTKPKNKWMPFTAQQYFNIENPAFVWKTKVEVMPFISMMGRDKLHNGEGQMLIKLAALIPVVDAGKNEKINQGAMLRFLAEMCWFPSAALNDYISWEAIDSTSAKGILSINKTQVSGIFTFTPQGDILSFDADRYYGGEQNATLEKWHIEMLSYKIFHGIKIPNKSQVTWKLLEGNFDWLKVEIIDLNYNTSEIY